MFSLHNTSGFYCASVSKFIIYFLVGVCFIINIFFISSKAFLQLSYQHLFEDLQFHKYLLLRCFFLDINELFFSIILFYNFRLFERRYGSAKFVSFIIFSFILSSCFEIVIFYIFFKFGFHPQKVPSGLWGPIFAFYVPYFFDVPKVMATIFCGVPISGKSITYLIGLQMVCGSFECIILACLGMISGAVYRSNLYIQAWTELPQKLRYICSLTLGRLLQSRKPKELVKPIGATIELQRMQRIEQMENQFRWTNHYN